MSKIIPDDVLDRVRQATDIVSLVRGVVPLKKAGAGLVGLCPFHKEKTPSFHVNPERQIFKCFGCGAAGDVFSFLQKTEGITFREAIVQLAERANITLPDSNEEQGEYQRGERARLYDVNLLAVKFFQHYLRRESGAGVRKYLAERGLTQETIDKFEIGYAPEGWDTFINAAQKKKFEPALLIKAGLAVAKEGSDRIYDRFRNRLMFPIRDSQERVIGFGARSMDGSEPKYLNSPETPLFSKGRTLYAIDRAKVAMREEKSAIIVEGYMDAVTLHQFGFGNTVAVLGTALSRDHVRVLRRHVEKAVLLFDGDSAGLSSASRSIDAFAEEELPVRVALMPDGVDPDDFVRKEGEPALRKRIDSAVEPTEFKLDRALAGKRAADAKALDDVLATIALMPNPVTRQQELRKIALRTGVAEFRLEERLNSLKRAEYRAPDAEQPAQQGNKRAAEQELLSAILTYPRAIPVVHEALSVELISDNNIRTLISRTFDFFGKGVEIDAAHLLARTPEEPLRAVIELVMGQPHMTVADPAEWCKELANEIAARAHEQTGRDMHRRIATKTSDDDGDKALMERLQATREAQRARGKLELRKAN